MLDENGSEISALADSRHGHELTNFDENGISILISI